LVQLFTVIIDRRPVLLFLRYFIFCFFLICANSLLAQKKNAKVPLVKFHKDNNPNVELLGQFIDDSPEKNQIGNVTVVIYEDTTRAAFKGLKQFEYPTKDKSLVYLETIKSNQEGIINFTLPSNKIFVLAINRKSYFISFIVVKTQFDFTPKTKTANYEFYYTLFKCEPNKMEMDTSNTFRLLVYDFNNKKFSSLNKIKPKSVAQLRKDSIKFVSNKNILKNKALPTRDGTESKINKGLTIDDKGNSFLVENKDTINILDANEKKQGKWRYSNQHFINNKENLQPNYIQGNYEDDNLAGIWNKYYSNDTLAIQFIAEKNKLTGNFKLFWPNGKLKSTGKWKPLTRKFIGPVKSYDQNGIREIDLSYDTTGILDGNQIIYYPNGLMAVLTSTKNGKFDGQQIVFTEEGKVLLQRLYDEGKLIKEQQFEKTKTKFSEKYIKEVLFQDTGILAEALNKAASEIEQLKANNKKQLDERNADLKEAGLLIENQKNKLEAQEKQLSRMQLMNLLQKQKLQSQRILFFGGLVLLILLFIIIYVLWKKRKEDKEKHTLLQELYHRIEEQHHEIIDSIEYAQRIQSSILPTKENILKAFPQSFILFKPKDIVSGDFYWFQEVEGKKYIAACDCTGHGVPGALMSMVATDMLNEALVHTKKVDEILAHTNRSIRLALKQSTDDDSTRDGMDLALCCFDDKTNLLKYAGAYRPLWLIRHAELDSASSTNAHDTDFKSSQNVKTVGKIAAQGRNDAWELIEYKATKAAIGGLTEDNQIFQLNEIQLQKGDTIYLSSDGYADQFSPADKKLMTKRFKEILLSIQHLSMPEQEKYLEKFITNWRGNIEQTDDVLVIGVRV
jgi:serine phosphatase RsbU (regulator of sigma subunit)/antitoxin component YwqK of YwqJK toxin-antitoxin module